MSKPRKDELLKMPYYKGGEDALRRFVSSQLKYPEEALKAKVEGEVEASYDVDGLGRTRNAKILSSLGYGCDQEVLRLIGLIKFEKAYNKGRKVTLHKKLKVNFKLPKEQQPAQQKINYQIVKETSHKKEAQQKKSQNITYTIKF